MAVRSLSRPCWRSPGNACTPVDRPIWNALSGKAGAKPEPSSGHRPHKARSVWHRPVSIDTCANPNASAAFAWFNYVSADGALAPPELNVWRNQCLPK